MRTIIAIDPGASGAIAVRDTEGRVFVDDMPETLRDVWELLETDGQEGIDVTAIMEDVGYHVMGNNASASAKFARHVGALEMALTGLGISWESVRPQKWMKHFGALPKDKGERKRRIKELVQRRYPHIKVTLANADALAILLWYIENKKED